MEPTEETLAWTNDAPSRLRIAQLVDFLGQVACFLVSGFLTQFYGSDRGVSSLFNRDFGILFLLGGWQLLSALLHLFVWKRIPGLKHGRRLHLIAVGILGLLLALSYLGEDRGDGTLLVLFFVLLFLSPILAALYFCLTAVDLWKLSGAAYAIEGAALAEDGRRVAPQALLLFFVLAPLYRLFISFRLGDSTVFLFVTYAGWLALAAWLLAGYLKARRMGQASLMETVCVGWAALVLGLSLLGLLSAFRFVLPSIWLSFLVSPTVVLSVWFAAGLWRGPLHIQIEDLPEAVGEA